MDNNVYFIYNNENIFFKLEIAQYENILDFLNKYNLYYIATDKIDFDNIPSVLIGRGKNINLLDYLSNNVKDSALTSKFLDYFFKEIVSIRNHENKIISLDFYLYTTRWSDIKLVANEGNITLTTTGVNINNSNTNNKLTAATKKPTYTSGTSGTSGIGIDGTSGTSGIGTDGTSGTSGIGIDGTSGTSGIGIDGTSGTSGIGINGTSGTSGIGIDGTSGTSGIDGSSLGTSGTSGVDGTNFGTSGTSGVDGTSGISGSGGTVDLYTNSTPVPTTIGGISQNTTFSNNTMTEMWNMLLYPYQTPSISSLQIQNQQTLIEVGETITSGKTFTWNVSNTSNIQQNSGTLTDTSSATILSTNIDLLTYSEDVTLNINNTTPISKSYRLSGLDVNTATINSNTYSINSIYPIFNGTYSSTSTSPPNISSLDITGGTKQVIYSSDNLPLTYNSNSDDYIWFAIPSSESLYDSWYISQLNYGDIGGNTNLFGDNILTQLNSVLWNNIDYNVYISNYRTSLSVITIKRN